MRGARRRRGETAGAEARARAVYGCMVGMPCGRRVVAEREREREREREAGLVSGGRRVPETPLRA